MYKVLYSILIIFVAWLNVVAGQAKPNIVLIMVDDLGFSDIGAYGGEVKTPNLDKLAEQGIRFRRFYNDAKCGASRVSLLMGASNYKALHNYSNPTLGHVLGAAGYHTYASGKHHSTISLFDRGFDHYYGLRDGMSNHFNPGLKREGEPEPASKGRDRFWCDDDLTFNTRDPNYQHYFPKGFYTTDAFTSKALEYLDEWEKEKSGRPFFLYLPYSAPHDPLLAWPEDIAKYDGVYDAGYGAIRKARYEKQQEIGLLDPETSPLSPATHNDWDQLSESEKAQQIAVMQTYAAMIDRVDQKVGEVIEKLKSAGVYENTLIMFCSDNGCEKVGSRQMVDNIGGVGTYVSPGSDWANVSNTPYRLFKLSAYNGGSRTPMIVHWPKGIKNPGRFTDKFSHLSDVMPTLIELAGASYPETFESKSERKLYGDSFVDVLQDQALKKRDPIFMQRGSHRYIIDEGYKLVTDDAKHWSLYKLSAEETEITDLSTEEPEKYQTLLSKYIAWEEGLRD
ncbi:arylsulfatase [Coraliomargarita algicola]|uniref:Arylsulfatase n=1 Tax=Coraliomargarita algicola TaxID=3092156 RepID=A0ABZ0RNQ0_9BACT|nr:arylsulfatase [Coraliomargarita sp. J2-16]WPJ96595.1 arylsulfatase [Coraliomargarita sp. J2-16]